MTFFNRNTFTKKKQLLFCCDNSQKCVFGNIIVWSRFGKKCLEFVPNFLPKKLTNSLESLLISCNRTKKMVFFDPTKSRFEMKF